MNLISLALRRSVHAFQLSSIERLSASIAEEARKAYQATAEQLDEKIQKAVAEAVKSLPIKRPHRGKGKQ